MRKISYSDFFAFALFFALSCIITMATNTPTKPSSRTPAPMGSATAYHRGRKQPCKKWAGSTNGRTKTQKV